MAIPKYSEEFKSAAINQVIEEGHSIVQVAKNLGISDLNLYPWIKKSGKFNGAAKKEQDNAELQKVVSRLKSEIRQLQEEWANIEKAAAYFAKESR